MPRRRMVLAKSIGSGSLSQSQSGSSIARRTIPGSLLTASVSESVSNGYGETMLAPRSRPAMVALLCTAQFVVVLDATIVAIALPAIQRSLGMATADLQWVLTAYTLAFAGFLVLAGRLADLHGRRRVFVAGLALFTGASLACGL